MSDRRTFLKQGMLLAAATGIPQMSLKSESFDIPEYTGDESYWSVIRNLFPLRKDHIFLNNGTMGPSPYSVIKAVETEANEIERTARYGGNEESAIKSLAEFLNTKESEISLTRNVTEGINIICWGLPLKEGEEVIMTGHEHVGHAAPWLNRAKLHGIQIKIMKHGQTAEETLQNLRSVITKKTRVISVPHIPCTIGQILPAKEICAMAKERGIFCLLDGAHPPGMLVTDMKDLGCDLYAGCCHKWMLGPKGTGFLYVSSEMREKVQAYYGGGGFDTGWDMLTDPPLLSGYTDNGHRYYYGTQNAALFKGISAAVDFQTGIGRERIEKRIRSLAANLQEKLLKLDNAVEMLTPTEEISRGAQIAFRLKEKDVSKLHKNLLDNKIITRFVPENGINCLRVSTHLYNSFEEIDSFIEITDRFIHTP